MKNVNQEVFTDLPDVLIQDSKLAISYYIEAKELGKYVADENMNLENTVTFVITQGELLDDVNLTNSSYINQSVLIKHSKSNTQYYIPFNKLEDFKINAIDQIEKIADGCITFILPTGDELLEDVPNLSRAMLQSNTPTPWSPVLNEKEA